MEIKCLFDKSDAFTHITRENTTSEAGKMAIMIILNKNFFFEILFVIIKKFKKSL
jgi:hypothetical protein